MSEYDPPERRKFNELRHFEVKQVNMRKGGAVCSGTASDYENPLRQWRDDNKHTYWFPYDFDFLNIDSIVKLGSVSGKKSIVAYLHFTVAVDDKIDGEELRKLNAIFYPDHVKNAGDTEPPIYIAVCPDLESCEALVLKPPPEVLAARKTCRVYVGLKEARLKISSPPPPYKFRKLLDTE